MDFIFWTFLIGIFVATLQDLKRREVDNWLNIFLILISSTYIILANDASSVVLLGIAFIFMYLLSNAFYYARVFAGGDAKLLFAMTCVFLGTTLPSTLLNIAVFIFLLMFSGSLYGILFSLNLYLRHYTNINKKIVTGGKKPWITYTLFAGVIFLLLCIVNVFFLFPAILALGFPLLYLFAKGLEEVAMIKKIPGNKLREGDWLNSDVSIGRKTIRANWEGLTKDDIKLLKNQKKVVIKEGMPFVPAFLLAYILYYIFRAYLITMFTILF